MSSPPTEARTVAAGGPSGLLHRLSRWVGVLEQIAGAMLVATILVLILLQVAQRFLPEAGGPWTGELARVSLVWCTFALAGHLTGRDQQISLHIIDHAVTHRMLGRIKVFAHLVVLVVALGFAREALALVTAGGPQRLPSLGISVIWMYVVPLVGFVLTAVRAGLAIFIGRNG